MVIHPGKTKCMALATRQKHQTEPLFLNLVLDNNPLEQIHSHKVLGVFIDDKLRWENHFNFLAKKLARNVYLLNRLTPYLDSNARKIFFHAHCLSHINYPSIVWDGAAKHHLAKLNSIYKHAVKIILPNPLLSTKEKQKALDILPLNKQLEFNKLMSVFKTRTNLVPDYVTNLLTKSNLPNSNNYLLPTTRINLFKTSFTFSGAHMWNSLPLSLKLCTSLSTFKKTLRHLLQNF